MNRNSLTAIIAVLLAVLCGTLVWLNLRTPPKPSPGPVQPQAAATPLPSAPLPGLTAVTPVPPAPLGPRPGPSTPAAPSIQPWEAQIDQVLRSNVSELEAAQILINTLPSLPEDGQVEAAHHISNLLEDKDYNRVMPILLNPSMPESVLSVFVTDLMNRSDGTKLPALLDIGKIPNHPFQEEAMSDLQIYLNEDYGTDWAKWKSALDQYLATAAAAQ